MGGGGSAPDAPNYKKLAKQNAKYERRAANKATRNNRPTQNNPYGQMKWTRGENGKWIQNETWDPRIQGMSDQNLGLQQKFMDQMMGQGDFEFNDLTQYDDSFRDRYADNMYDSVMNRARPEQERNMESFRGQLRQQGLQPGTEAYDRAMQNLMTSQGDVNQQASLNAQIAAGAEGRADWGAQNQGETQQYNQDMDEYRMPWEQLSSTQAAMGGIPKPQFAGFSGATGYQPADMMGAAQQQWQAEMGSASADNAKKGSNMSGIASMGSMGK